MLFCKSLASCPRAAPVNTVSVAVQTSPFIQHDAPWRHLMDLFYFDRRFPIAEQLYIDIYAHAAGDLAEQSTKDLVNLIHSSFALARPSRDDLAVNVHRKLGMHQFDWYVFCIRPRLSQSDDAMKYIRLCNLPMPLTYAHIYLCYTYLLLLLCTKLWCLIILYI